MTSWRSRLRDIVKSKGSTKEERTGEQSKSARARRLEAFFDHTVLPAFRSLQRELEQSDPDVKAEIDREPYQITLSVLRNDEREFFYTVREVRYHEKTFAFPQIVRRSESKEQLVQVAVPGKDRKARKPEDFSREGIIDDFLRRYEKCLGS